MLGFFTSIRTTNDLILVAASLPLPTPVHQISPFEQVVVEEEAVYFDDFGPDLVKGPHGPSFSSVNGLSQSF